MSENRITQNQYIFILISSMIGIGVLALPSNVCKTAHQQGWISPMICGIYPIFIVVTAALLDKKTNHADFWDINNIAYGKILCHIFIFIFFFYFLTIMCSVAAGYVNTLNNTIVTFLHPLLIIIPILLMITLISLKGLSIVGRLCEFIFYLTLPLIAILLFFIPKGSLINIKPFISSYNEILKSVPDSFLTYSLVEISYITISKISNKTNTKKAGIIACMITIFIYTFVVFISIYYLGWEMTSKLYNPILYMTETINIPVISDFGTLFFSLWSFVIFKSLICDNFVISYLLSKLFKISYKKGCILSSIIALIYILFMIPEQNRQLITEKLTFLFVIFSTLWGLITTISVYIKCKNTKNY